MDKSLKDSQLKYTKTVDMVQKKYQHRFLLSLLLPDFSKI